MKNYRLDKAQLWEILEGWDEYLPRKIRVVACGGTALTLQDLKPSTKDVDFIVPELEEYEALIKTLKRLGYRKQSGFGWKRDDDYIFDLFPGTKIFTTELLDSPLEPGKSTLVRALKKLSVSVLNDLDLVISKMFRGDEVDVEDCLLLIKERGEGFDLAGLKRRYREAADDNLNPEKMMKNLDYLLAHIKDK